MGSPFIIAEQHNRHRKNSIRMLTETLLMHTFLIQKSDLAVLKKVSSGLNFFCNNKADSHPIKKQFFSLQDVKILTAYQLFNISSREHIQMQWKDSKSLH